MWLSDFFKSVSNNHLGHIQGMESRSDDFPIHWFLGRFWMIHKVMFWIQINNKAVQSINSLIRCYVKLFSSTWISFETWFKKNKNKCLILFTKVSVVAFRSSFNCKKIAKSSYICNVMLQSQTKFINKHVIGLFQYSANLENGFNRHWWR
jgi:hypothetical protein